MFVQLAVPPQLPHETGAGLFDQAVVDVVGVQIWHALAALVAALCTYCPPIQQPAWQTPLTHTLAPPPQAVPLVLALQVPVEHELHSPHAVLQQMPLTQFPFLH